MATMTLDQMRIFLAVAEHLHFTRAAEALYITQPSVSAAIQNLEVEYGVKLFDRMGRHIEITDAGKLLQAEAKKILDHVTLTERGLRELNHLQRGELHVGASMIIGNYWLPQKLCAFKQAYPGIVIHCTLGNAEAICEGVASGNFDLGLVTQAVKPALQNCLGQEIIGSDRICIVVGRSHPWFGRSTISIEALLNTAWVMRESGSGVQQSFEHALHIWGIDPTQLDVLLALNSSEMVKTVAESGIAAAALPALMVSNELQFGTLHAISVVEVKAGATRQLEIIQPIWKLRHPQRFQTRLSIAFEQSLTDAEFPVLTQISPAQ